MTGIFTGAFSDMILSKLSSLCCKFFLKTASLPTCIYLYCTIGSKSWLNLEKHLGHSKHGGGGGGEGKCATPILYSDNIVIIWSITFDI